MQQPTHDNLSRKLRKAFEEKIRSGEWPVGERLPTTRALASEYGVSVNTIQSAFRELEATDLVERRPRLGGFVKGRPIEIVKPTNVAVIVPREDADYGAKTSDSWTYRIIRACDRALHDADLHISIYSYDDNSPEATRKLLNKLDQTASTLAGVLCFLRDSVASLPSELDRRNIAWVSVNRTSEHAVHNFVAQDALYGGRLIGRCLAAMKLSRAVVLSHGISLGRSNGDMFYGFIHGWIERGGRTRDVDYVECTLGVDADGVTKVREYLQRYGKPEVIYALGDFLAIDAMRALREAGYVVGKDVHVIGGTGLGIAKMSDPPMTVSEVPMDQMGEEAARLLLEMSREGVRRMLGRYLPTRLIVRESCPIPQAVVDREVQDLEEEKLA
jgi:DNA-binding LacI/PurR family transcriptional regulator